MRPVYLCDLDSVARALLAVPQDARETLAKDVVQQARIADKYRKRIGVAHPDFGTGTLASAAQDLAKSTARSCDADYRFCLAQVLVALANHNH